jgi:phosphatidylglycerol:prolipoprotein diacylglycerol transferase
MIGIGLILAVLFLDYRIKKNWSSRITEIDLYLGIVISIILSLLGSKLFYLFYNKQNISIDNLLIGGMTYYGGFICGIITFSIYNLIRKMNILYMLNITVPSIVLVHAFGRIGCFLGGCCFGKPINKYFGVIFPYNSLPFNFYGQSIKIYPIQLFESFFLFFLFVLMIKIIKFNYNLFTYFILYGFFRFIIEYFRGDNRGILFTNLFSPSQIISISVIILGIVLYILIRRGNIENKKLSSSIVRQM